jgi:hypothetical protein
VTYNADEKAGQRFRGSITIGGKTFHPRKKSGRLMKQLIADGPDPLPEGAEPTKEQSAENIDYVYQQLAVLLVPADQEGEVQQSLAEQDEKAMEWLEDELDFEDAQELIAKLMPNKGAGKEEGAA